MAASRGSAKSVHSLACVTPPHLGPDGLSQRGRSDARRRAPKVAGGARRSRSIDRTVTPAADVAAMTDALPVVRRLRVMMAAAVVDGPMVDGGVMRVAAARAGVARVGVAALMVMRRRAARPGAPRMGVGVRGGARMMRCGRRRMMMMGRAHRRRRRCWFRPPRALGDAAVLTWIFARPVFRRRGSDLGGGRRGDRAGGAGDEQQTDQGRRLRSPGCAESAGGRHAQA